MTKNDKDDVLRIGAAGVSGAGSLLALHGLRGYLTGKRSKHLEPLLKTNITDAKNITDAISKLEREKYFYKTPGISSGNINQLKRMDPELIDSFIKKHNLTEKGIRIAINPSQIKTPISGYDPKGKRVFLETTSPGIALHELSHAKDFSKLPMLKTKALGITKKLTAAAIPLSIILGDRARGHVGEKTEKVIDFIQEHPVATTMAGYTLPTVIPEVAATTRAISHIKDIRGKEKAFEAFSKHLKVPMINYATAGIPLMIAGLVAKKILEKQREDNA